MNWKIALAMFKDTFIEELITMIFSKIIIGKFQW